MRFNKLMVAGALGVTLLSIASCGTPKEIAYFQDIAQKDTVLTLQQKVITVKPQDKLTIIVKSKDNQLSELFNLAVQSSRVGYTNTTNSSQQMAQYTIDSEGNIDFPVVGKINVGGLTREAIAAKVKSELINQNLVKDPVVTVEFGNLSYSVMGEVQKPGKYAIDNDHVTILDALSEAGDLTIYGKRTDVMVLRQEDGHQKVYSLNLCSGKDVANSPVYYLQQNDVVYVSPNETKARQSTVNGNNIRSTGFWISLASLATSVAVLIKK